MVVAEMVNSGWIKLHRKFLEWEWYGDHKVVSLFVHCLLKANHKKKNWRGNEIPRGTFITSYETLQKETGLSIRELRTAFTKLESTGEIDKRSTALNSWVKVTNYNDYQDCDKAETSKRQRSDKGATTTKNDNNEKNEKEVYAFEDFWDDYGNKKERPYCEDKWQSISDKDKKLIKDFIPIYKKHLSNSDYLKQKYPKTFLNQKIWKDDWSEYETEESKQGMGQFFI